MKGWNFLGNSLRFTVAVAVVVARGVPIMEDSEFLHDFGGGQ